MEKPHLVTVSLEGITNHFQRSLTLSGFLEHPSVKQFCFIRSYNGVDKDQIGLDLSVHFPILGKSPVLLHLTFPQWPANIKYLNSLSEHFMCKNIGMKEARASRLFLYLTLFKSYDFCHMPIQVFFSICCLLICIISQNFNSKIWGGYLKTFTEPEPQSYRNLRI